MSYILKKKHSLKAKAKKIRNSQWHERTKRINVKIVKQIFYTYRQGCTELEQNKAAVE